MTINVNNATQALSNCQSRKETAVKQQGISFLESVKHEYVQAMQKNAPIDKVTDIASMNMEQYKQYIHDQISQIPMHASRALSSVSITISEAGFEAMKKDPEYEKWVLNSLKINAAGSNPWVAICGGGYETHYFGATKEEYHGEGWYPGYAGGSGEALFNQKAENNFWEKRTEKHYNDDNSPKTNKESENDFWEKRVEKHKKNMEIKQELWEKRQMIEAQMTKLSVLDVDGKKAEYLAGVPASMLLSMIM